MAGGRGRVERVELALSVLAGGSRAARGLLKHATASQMRAELLRRAQQDVDDAVSRVGARAAPAWLADQLAPPARSGASGSLAVDRTRRDTIAAMRRRGMGQRAIAQELGISVATVGAALVAVDPATLPAFTLARNGRRMPARREMPELVPDGEPADVAAQLWGQGWSTRAIARALGVGRARVTSMLARSAD